MASWDDAAWKDDAWKEDKKDGEDDSAWKADTAWKSDDKETGASTRADAGNSWDSKGDEKGASWDSTGAEWDSKPANEWGKKDEAHDANGTNGTSWGGNDSWDKKEDKKDDWGGGGWGGEDDRPKPNGRAYWEAQEYNKENNVLPGKEAWEMDRDDQALFKERLGNPGINFAAYDKVPVDVTPEAAAKAIAVAETFEDLYEQYGDIIPTSLKENVTRCQYAKPTPVQKYAIPVGLVGRDVMCCAQTGSGKTAAFLIPIIGRMMKNHQNPIGDQKTPFEGQCDPDTLIITPTRELCIQIYEESLKFCHRTPYRVVQLYGGSPTKDQMWECAKGCDLMVCTPGRIKDFIDREIVRVDRTYVLVLDEADRMLDMGFLPAIKEIVNDQGMPDKEHRQTMMFSATFPEEIQKLAQDFLYDYVWVGTGIVGGAVDTVEQKLQKVAPSEKFEKLIEVLDAFFEKREKNERCLVFVNTKDTAKFLDEKLYDSSYDTGSLHGNLDQTQREQNLRRFRDGEIDVMIATDVASRGLDIEHVSLVVNYDMAQTIDSYVHRIGRTGRIGNRGVAISFIAYEEPYGCSESGDLLKSLLKVMRDANSTAPDWLEGLSESAGAQGGGWKWGSEDMRYSGGGDGADKWAWDSYEKNKGGGDDSWGAKEEPAAEEKKEEATNSGGGGW